MQQTEALLEAWLKQRTILEKLLLAIPDHHANFMPWDGAMTVSELAQHIGASADRFIRVAKTGEGQIGMPQTVDCPSMKEVRRIAQEWTAKTTVQDLDRRRSGDGLPFAISESGWAAKQARPARHRSRDSSQRTALHVRPHTRGARTAISTVKTKGRISGTEGTSRSACCPISFLRA
uniref:hypothetical protein n=1 Tax=Paenibacillus thiaminolyticus TaxID=49283 RepID=UPI00403EB666